MRVERLHIQGYRSLRDFRVDLGRLNVVVGANGCGKSNLYRALYLMHAAASGNFARELALEGGLLSALWAGERAKVEEAKIRLAVTFDEVAYEMLFGRVPLLEGMMTPFADDPHIKEEKISIDYRGKISVVTHRKGAMLTAKNMDGRTFEQPLSLGDSESILFGLRDAHQYPEPYALRELLLNWRFYHDFRTDLDSPLRQPQIGCLTHVLAHDGIDVAAALATIMAMGGGDTLNMLFSEAFPGSTLSVEIEGGYFRLLVKAADLYRPFEAFEFSDGTLRFICLLAALLSSRPPGLLTLNEPETSIHPHLYPVLARLIARASEASQLIVTTHADELAALLGRVPDARVIRMEKVDGQTNVA